MPSHFPNENPKYIQPEHLKEKVTELKKIKKKIATLNGSFDLLHAGHLEILTQAAQQADCLIVALNTDDSIQRYKGRAPIVPLRFRLQLMAALCMIDYVTWFEEDDPRALLQVIQPEVHVNGSEYGENCIEAEVVGQGGGRVHIVQKIPGLSTSEIVEKIKSRL